MPAKENYIGQITSYLGNRITDTSKNWTVNLYKNPVRVKDKDGNIHLGFIIGNNNNTLHCTFDGDSDLKLEAGLWYIIDDPQSNTIEEFPKETKTLKSSNRPSWDKYFIDLLPDIASRSVCLSR